MSHCYVTERCLNCLFLTENICHFMKLGFGNTKLVYRFVKNFSFFIRFRFTNSLVDSAYKELLCCKL